MTNTRRAAVRGGCGVHGYHRLGCAERGDLCWSAGWPDGVSTSHRCPGCGRTPLSAKGTDEVLTAARRRAGLGHATCHELRHACLTRLREAGMALEAVQAQAGHASIESTRIYPHLADDWLASQYRKAAEVIDAQVFAGQPAAGWSQRWASRRGGAPTGWAHSQSVNAHPALDPRPPPHAGLESVRAWRAGVTGIVPDEPIRVLVCDDQSVVRIGFATILSAQPDMKVVGEASNGAIAIREAQRLQPDVVVMDIQMPVVDGIEATARLAGPAVDGATAPKVLIVTTFNLDEYVYRALRVGASGFLLKDAPPGDLIGAVRTVAAGDSLLSPAVTRRLIGRFAGRIRPSDPAEPEAGQALSQLTRREREVLSLIATGMSNAEIAGALFISAETVKTYVSRILVKLGLRDRVQAVVLAYQEGLVSPRN